MVAWFCRTIRLAERCIERSFGKSTGGPATVSDRYAETGPSGSRCLRSVPISEPLSKRHSTTAYTAGYYPGWIVVHLTEKTHRLRFRSLSLSLN